MSLYQKMISFCYIIIFMNEFYLAISGVKFILGSSSFISHMMPVITKYGMQNDGHLLKLGVYK